MKLRTAKWSLLIVFLGVFFMAASCDFFFNSDLTYYVERLGIDRPGEATITYTDFFGNNVAVDVIFGAGGKIWSMSVQAFQGQHYRLSATTAESVILRIYKGSAVLATGDQNTPISVTIE